MARRRTDRDRDLPANTPADEGEEVGYGKPPVQHRFRPGRSGNPKGRPKRPATLQEVLHNRMFAPVTVTENGKRRNIPMIDVVVAKQLKSAANGDHRAAALIARLMTFFAGRTEGPEQSVSAPDPAADHAALMAILSSLGMAPDTSSVPTERGVDDVT